MNQPIGPAPDPDSVTELSSISRRSLLAYAVSAPVLTVAAGFGANLAAPSNAVAALPTRSSTGPWCVSSLTRSRPTFPARLWKPF